jgi:hypothetical protein
MRRARPLQLVSVVLSARIRRRRRTGDEIEDPPQTHSLNIIN